MLIHLDHADPLFLKKITERCGLLAGKLTDFQRLKLLAFRRYQDHKRFLEMEHRFAERFLEERTPRSSIRNSGERHSHFDRLWL
jgi:hypothetical protein